MYEERIRTLEAQLARRDAELEARGEHVGHVALEPNPTSKKEMHKKKGYGKEPAPMAQEEVMTVLQRTTVRNKTLEEEIRNLFKRVRIYVPLPMTNLLSRFIYASSLKMHAPQGQLHHRHNHCPLSRLQSMTGSTPQLKLTLVEAMMMVHHLRSLIIW